MDGVDGQPGATSEVGQESQDTNSQISDPNLIPNYDSVPNEYRQHLDPIIKQMQSNIGKKFEEHANYRKQFEPYEQLGITEVEPETLGDLLQLLEVMNNEEQFKEWYDAVGQQYGWNSQDDAEYEDDDFDVEDEESFNPEMLQNLINQTVEQAIAPYQQVLQEQEQQTQLQNADAEIGKQLDALREEHGDFDQEAEAYICKLALAHGDDPEALQKGFQDYQQLVGKGESELFDATNNAPSRPEGEGVANTSVKSPTTMKEAEALALERLEQMSNS